MILYEIIEITVCAALSTILCLMLVAIAVFSFLSIRILIDKIRKKITGR